MKPREAKISVGISSMLMIFIVLTITTFSVLSFITAKNDYEWSVKSIESIETYYTADVIVQEKKMGIDAVIDRFRKMSEAAAQSKNTDEIDTTAFLDTQNSEFPAALEKAVASADAEKIYGVLLDYAKIKDIEITSHKTHCNFVFVADVDNEKKIFLELRVSKSLDDPRYTVIAHMVGTERAFEEQTFTLADVESK